MNNFRRHAATGIASLIFIPGNTMAQNRDSEDISMLLYSGANLEMASEQIALSLAEMVLKRVYGEATVAEQLPLQISDGGDRWLVHGTQQVKGKLPIGLLKGDMEVEILKANCQIIRLTQKAIIPAP